MTHPDLFSIEVPAQSRYLRPLRAFSSSLLEGRCPGAADLVLALDECCSNIIKYRSASLGEDRIRLHIELRDEGVVFRIGSFCTTDDLPQIRSRDLERIRPGGLGTHFVGEIMDRVVFEPDPERPQCCTLVLEKRFRSEGTPDE